MASHLLRIPHGQTTIKPPPTQFRRSKPLSAFLSIPINHQTYLLLSCKNHSQRLKVFSLSPAQDLTTTTPLTPPSTREEAISQARTCLSTTLKKPLNNPVPLPTRKLKKLSQPRYRIEIPVADDSPGSLAKLAFEVFSGIPISKKGATPTILLIWPNATLLELGLQAFGLADSSVAHSDLSSMSSELLSSSDLAVVLAPEASQLEEVKLVANDLYPKPVVLFNPSWGFEEEKGFGGGLGNFVGSFDVVYSFMGLEVRGVLSSRKGVVFKCVKGGVVSGDGWVVLVEEEGKGELKPVSRFKRRPSISEVENVLYNVMAANSPVTKSVKFLRDLASNVTGKNKK